MAKTGLVVQGAPHARLAADLAKFNKPPPVAKYAINMDAWANTITGIGTQRDKVTATGFSQEGGLPFALLEELYHNDDVSARICDLIPQTALREQFEVNDEDLAKQMYDLRVCEIFEEAWIFSRLYGGAAVIIGMPGESSLPAAAGDVRSLMLIDRWALSVDSYYDDSSEPLYGQPKTYRIQRPTLLAGVATPPPKAGEIIHESRLIIFPGARTSPRKRRANGYWDDSVLQRVHAIVQGYGITWASVVHLLQDAAQGVYKMKDLWNMIAEGHKEMVEERMALVDEQRSSARMVLTDADNEDFTRVPTPFSGIPELIDRMSERLASASGYPLTVLMGSSPSGMNATGKSDLEIFYGRVGSDQKKILTPRISKLAALMGKPDVKITYPALWMPTEKEVAESRYITAQTDQLYTRGMAILDRAEVRKSRFVNGWSASYDVEADAPPPEDPLEVAAEAEAEAAAADPAAAGGSNAPGTAVGQRRFSSKYGR